MLGEVKADVGFQLDIVTQLRRLRAHGFALSMMFDKGILHICSDKAKTKPLVRNVVLNESQLWERYEQYTNREKFIVCITRQYIDIIGREKEALRLKTEAERAKARLEYANANP